MRKDLVLFLLLLLAGCTSTQQRRSIGPQPGEPWKAIHLLGYNTDGALDTLSMALPELASLGINVIILEIDYHFAYESHPELRQGKEFVSKRAARDFAKLTRKNGIRLIPQFQVLGHQSWAEETFPLLTVYPEFDLTPGSFPNNEGLYCREWDPTNKRINPIIFALIDELIDAFEADAFHVGMDEVFLLGSDESPSTKGMDPARLFAQVVNEYHEHIVEKRGIEMLMWGDRFIDASVYDYGRWEAADNGIAPAVDLVPKDIIICDWHYEPREDGYPSVQMFVDKGFRVLPTGWQNIDASNALIEYSNGMNSPKVLGHLFSTWSKLEEPAAFLPMVKGLELMQDLRYRGREVGAEK